MSTILDQYIARMENIPSFNIHSVSADGMESNPWYEVKSSSIVRDLVLDEVNLGHQVQIITGEIQKWGRLLSQCKRVWELSERNYRTWRSRFVLDQMQPPAGTGKGVYEDKDGWTLTAKGEPKSPTKETVEALYRVHSEYQQQQVLIERAEESYNATNAVYEAFKAKRDMLKQVAYRHRDSGQPQLSV